MGTQLRPVWYMIRAVCVFFLAVMILSPASAEQKTDTGGSALIEGYSPLSEIMAMSKSSDTSSLTFFSDYESLNMELFVDSIRRRETVDTRLSPEPAEDTDIDGVLPAASPVPISVPAPAPPAAGSTLQEAVQVIRGMQEAGASRTDLETVLAHEFPNMASEIKLAMPDVFGDGK